MNLFKVEKLSKNTETEIKNKDMFLPKSKFLEKASVYNVKVVIKHLGKNLFSIYDKFISLAARS